MKNYTVSYAQNREDIIIDAFFEGMENGVYVDVGANHPVIDSVTKIFSMKGWRGVDIEPNEDLARLLEADRPKSTIITKGVSDKKGRATFRIYKSDGLSTYSEKVKNETGSIYDFFKNDYKDVETEIDTLGNILDGIPGLTRIDFMKIDIEGMEYQALLGNNWKKYRPELICIEANHVDRDWGRLLIKEGYVKFFNDGLNDYYGEKDSERMKRFAFPESVFMKYPKIVPFIPHRDALEVSDETFSLSNQHAEQPPLKQTIVGAFSVFHNSLRTLLVRRIIKLKRAQLDKAVQRSFQSGRAGHVKSVNFMTAKIILVRCVFYGHSVFMKAAHLVQARGIVK